MIVDAVGKPPVEKNEALAEAAVAGLLRQVPHRRRCGRGQSVCESLRCVRSSRFPRVKQWEIYLFTFEEEMPHPAVILSNDERCANKDYATKSWPSKPAWSATCNSPVTRSRD